MNIDDFISMEEAVRLSGYKRGNITYLCREGKLPGARKIGNRWLIPRKALEEYQPGPKGFAAVWERRRAEEAAMKNEIEAAIAESNKEKEGQR